MKRLRTAHMSQERGAPTPVVLLVAASADDSDMYTEYLRQKKFTIIPVGNTKDALALAPAVDLVVTGIRVPGPIDGLELVRRLREEPATRDKAIIVLTACAFEHNRTEAHLSGCDAFLVKPCLPEELAAAVHQTIAKRRPDPFRRTG